MVTTHILPLQPVCQLWFWILRSLINFLSSAVLSLRSIRAILKKICHQLSGLSVSLSTQPACKFWRYVTVWAGKAHCSQTSVPEINVRSEWRDCVWRASRARLSVGVAVWLWGLAWELVNLLTSGGWLSALYQLMGILIKRKPNWISEGIKQTEEAQLDMCW